MNYTIHGRLCGYICDDCEEPLEGVIIRLYEPVSDDVVGRAAADPKDTVRVVDPDDPSTAARRLLAEATAGPGGAFSVELSDKDYDGRALDVDLLCDKLPHQTTRPRPPAPVQLHLTTFQPRWRQTDHGLTAAFEHCLAARIWCWLRSLLGAWVVCGRVTVCDKDEPVAGVTVKAFDADWLQDDALGSAVTDGDGHFRIDYSLDDFHRTPFSPLINIELVSGPDLYFRIEGPAGTALLVEPRSQGRTPGRQNASPCTCVSLCVSGQVPPGPVPTIPMFTKVGSYRIDPVYNHFNPAGTTASGDLAFTGDIPLIGIMPDPLSPDAVEYRFLVGQLPAAPVAVDAARMAPTIIGELQYFAWSTLLSAWVVRSADYWANNSGATVSIPQSAGPPLNVSVNTEVKPGGWIEAPRTNQLFPGGHGRFIPNGNLSVLRTRAYTDEAFDLTAAAPPLPLEAGETVPAAQRSSRPTFSITFEARKVVGGVAVGTNSLATIAFSNMTDTYRRHPYWADATVTTVGVASLGIAEMAASGGCAEMGDEIHVLYTAYHPYLGQPSVYFDGNPVLPSPLAPAVSATGEALSPTGGELVDISLLAKCAYILWLEVPLRLTSGYGSLGWILSDHIGFCKA